MLSPINHPRMTSSPVEMDSGSGFIEAQCLQSQQCTLMVWESWLRYSQQTPWATGHPEIMGRNVGVTTHEKFRGCTTAKAERLLSVRHSHSLCCRRAAQRTYLASQPQAADTTIHYASFSLLNDSKSDVSTFLATVRRRGLGAGAGTGIS